MKLVIYSGSYSINSLGATKSLCTKIVSEFFKMGYEVTWIGRGELEDSDGIVSYSLSNSALGEFSIKVKNKLLRTFFNVTPNDIAINEFVHYDKIVSSKIKSGEILVDEETVFLALGGMSLFSFEEAKKKGAKTVLASQFLHPNSHNDLLEKEYKKLNIQVEPIPRARIDRQLKEIEIVDKIWVFSDFAQESFINNKINGNKVVNTPLGVDFELYSESKRKLSKKNSEVNLLFVGNVNPEKGAHVLLDSLCDLELKKETKVNLIFNGAVARYFKHEFDLRVQKLESKGVKVSVEPGVPLKNYMKSSIFILPSTHDSFGLVVLEAMASGLPVIVSSKVGAKDCVVQDVNGFIFEESSREELKVYLDKLISNKGLRDSFGQKSQELSKEYDWSKSMEKLAAEIM